MRILGGVLLAIVLTLFCISALGVVTAIVSPHLYLQDAPHQSWATGTDNVITPIGVIHWKNVALVLFSVIGLAVLLRWRVAGPRHHGRHGETPVPPTSELDPDMASLARDLHYTARRLEERVEALETILLDRTRTAEGWEREHV